LYKKIDRLPDSVTMILSTSHLKIGVEIPPRNITKIVCYADFAKQKQGKGEIDDMFKKVTIATAFSAALLFGGAVQSVDASATFNLSQSQDNVSRHDSTSDSGNRYIHIKTFQDFLDHFYNNNKGNWHSNEDRDSNHSGNMNKDESKQPQTEDNSDASEGNSNGQAAQTDESQSTTGNQSNQVEEDQNDSGQLNEFEKEVVSLTNKEREKNGLQPLKADAELSVVARDKSKDMRSNGYFAHNSPTYGSPFDMMKSYGISYRTAGENIARGQRTPSEVVNAWMNSQGHRENILNPNFTH